MRARLLSARLAPLHGSHRRSLCFNTREAAVMFRDDFARSGAVKSKRQRLCIPSALNKTLTTYYKAATVRRGGHGTWETRRNDGASGRVCWSRDYGGGENLCARLDNAPNSYKEARAHPDAAGWMQACDEEMTSLRRLGCWTVFLRFHPSTSYSQVRLHDAQRRQRRQGGSAGDGITRL